MKNQRQFKPKSTMAKIKKLCGTKFIKFSWTNSKNAAVYKKKPLHYFKKEAVQGGLDNGCDVKAIAKYIKNAKSILEVGAGYGRVLNHIVKNDFKGKLFALEREPKLCRFLKKRFAQTQIICTDIRQFKVKYKFDLILWMWASLCEFSKKEQLSALKNLVSHLNTNGFLIFDLIPISCKTINTIDHDAHNRVVTSPYGDDYGYFPSPNEIKRYTRRLKLLTRKVIIYKTKTHKKRNLYVLQKN